MEICRCRCHNNSGVFKTKHIAACCYKCNICGQQIKVEFWESHKAKHEQDNKNV